MKRKSIYRQALLQEINDIHDSTCETCNYKGKNKNYSKYCSKCEHGKRLREIGDKLEGKVV